MRCLIESPGKLYHFESSTYEGRKDGVECLEPKEGGAKFTVPLNRGGSSLPRPLVPSFFWPFRTPTHPLACSLAWSVIIKSACFCGGMLQHQLGLLLPPSRRVRRSRTYFSHRSTALCATDFSKPTEDTERRRPSIAVSRDWTDVTASTFAAASSDAAVAASGATFIKNQLQIGVLVAFARANGKAICERPQSNPLRQRGWKFCSRKPTETDRLVALS